MSNVRKEFFFIYFVVFIKLNRYFKIDLTNLISTFFTIEIIESVGMTDVYYSFEERNPTLENSENFYRKKFAKHADEKSISNFFLIEAPSMNVKTLYFTIVGVDDENEIQFTVKNEDFI